jgi:hypothetical protein
MVKYILALVLAFSFAMPVMAQPRPLESVDIPQGAAPASAPAPAPAAQPPQLAGKEMIAIYGHGNSKCSAYLDYVGRGQEMVTKNYQIWLNGFISSYNTFMSQTGNVTKGKKADEMMSWIENYCRANPDNFFQRATIEMLRALDTGRF